MKFKVTVILGDAKFESEVDETFWIDEEVTRMRAEDEALLRAVNAWGGVHPKMMDHATVVSEKI